MSSISFSEVATPFSTMFKTIDLRMVAVKPKDCWQNVITSIYFSSETVEELESEHKKLREKLPRGNDFSILLHAASTENLQEILKQFRKGEITIENTLVLFKLDPSNLQVDQHNPHYLKTSEHWTLVGFAVDSKKDAAIWPIIENQRDPARLLGFENIYDLINETLRMKRFYRSNNALVIGIPLPGRILHAKLSDSKLKAKIEKKHSLRNLQLNLSHRRANTKSGYFEHVKRGITIVSVKDCKKSAPHDLCFIETTHTLKDLKPYDQIEVELICTQVPSIKIDKVNLEVPLRYPMEPFAKVFSTFCPANEFKDRLLSPENFKSPSQVFENAVTWLLSLIGYSPLHLGREFEKLRVPRTQYEKGSADIIAFREGGCLLLVDCDTSIPDDKKIRSMLSLQDCLLDMQDEYDRPQIIPLIFSPRSYAGIVEGDCPVRIVDKDKIRRIFRELMKGNSKTARIALLY